MLDDAWLWVSIYLAVSFCCSLVVFNRFHPRVYPGLMIGYCFYATILFCTKNEVWDWISICKMPRMAEKMQAAKRYIERAHASFGLLIITPALLIDCIASPENINSGQKYF